MGTDGKGSRYKAQILFKTVSIECNLPFVLSTENQKKKKCFNWVCDPRKKNVLDIIWATIYLLNYHTRAQ